MLVDRWSGGEPRRAGRAYAVNVAGCLLGLLLAGFVLLPLLGERWSLAVLSLPLLAARMTAGRRRARFAAVLACGVLVAASHDFETALPSRVVERHATATVIASVKGGEPVLYVNGINMTGLSPITKMMAHLPLAALERPAHTGRDVRRDADAGPGAAAGGRG